MLNVISVKSILRATLAHISMQQDIICRPDHAKIMHDINFSRRPRPSCYVLRHRCKVSTPFEGIGAVPCRDLNDAGPMPTLSFSQEVTMGACVTRTIARNHVNHIENN